MFLRVYIRRPGFLEEDRRAQAARVDGQKGAILSTVRISSRLAPASSAARICRRVPSGLRFVQAALTAKPISSTALRGRTSCFQGFSVTRSAASAHAGSHSRNFANAIASQGPGEDVSPVAAAAEALSLLVISVSSVGSAFVQALTRDRPAQDMGRNAVHSHGAQLARMMRSGAAGRGALRTQAASH